MEKHENGRYPNNRTNGQGTGFIASLENLSENLLQLVTEDDSNNNQEDQLQ